MTLVLPFGLKLRKQNPKTPIITIIAGISLPAFLVFLYVPNYLLSLISYLLSFLRHLSSLKYVTPREAGP